MKVLIALGLLALATAAVVPESSPVISSIHDDELDPFTASFLESFGGFGDDDNTDSNGDNDMLAELEDNDDEEADSRPDVISANVNEDGMIEVDDMVISPDMFDVMFPSVKDHPSNGKDKSIHRRATALSSKSKLWPGAKIPYAYNRNLLGSQSRMRAAMNEWEKATCVKFVQRRSESRYVQIRSRFDSRGRAEDKCSATLGYTGRVSYINLGKNCFSHNVLLHELGHTLGLIHEHQHPDRDRYVTIYWNNVNPKEKHNFDPKSGISSWGYAYDPTSIMHYRSTSFKKSGCRGSSCITMQSKQGSRVTDLMGKSKHLSTKSDIPIVNKMYCNRG